MGFAVGREGEKWMNLIRFEMSHFLKKRGLPKLMNSRFDILIVYFIHAGYLISI